MLYRCRDKKDRATIYIDESGTPNVADLSPPVFVVAAVVIESKKDVAALQISGSRTPCGDREA